jgi:hypothetical protein
MGNTYSNNTTICYLSIEQFDEICKNQLSKNLVQTNISNGWIYVVLPKSCFCYKSERISNKIIIHLNYNGDNNYVTSVDRRPGIYKI